MKQTTWILLLGGMGFFSVGIERAWAQFAVQMSTPGGQVSVTADRREDTIWVNVLHVAQGLGADVFENKNGEYVFQFPNLTTVLNPHTSIYRVRKKKGSRRERRWKYQGLSKNILFVSERDPLVPLPDLPDLFKKEFTYHLQKKVLEENKLQEVLQQQGDLMPVSVRYRFINRRLWVALEDVSRALGVAVYSSQSNRFNLVMPDFSIVEVRVKDNWVYRKQKQFKFLEDPLLLFGGKPHISLRSTSTLFESELRWDKAKKKLLVPNLYGRIGDQIFIEQEPLTYIGYIPDPLRFSLDEFVSYYQKPGPTFPAANEEVFESVRDFFTNDAAKPDTHSFERVSGDLGMTLEGSLAGKPFFATGSFEKFGTRASLSSGNLEWGFPNWQLTAGREFLRVAGFNGQIDLVDHVAVSHSTDRFDDNDVNPVFAFRAMGGENFFTVFASTAFFSQTVDYRQRMAQGTVDVDWRMSRTHRMSFTLDQFYFINKVRVLSSEFNFFDLFFDDGLDVAIGDEEAAALRDQVLSQRHSTSVADLNYEWVNRLSLNGTFGLSYFRDPVGDRSWILDEDKRISMRLGGKRSRVDISHERVGARFRSLGDPLQYQARNISRLAPYLYIGRPWRLLGTFRREDVGERIGGDTGPFRIDYMYLVNSLSFSGFALRNLLSKYDHDLSGKIWRTSTDLTKYLGRDSVDVGAEWATQYFADGRIYRQSYTGRLGFRLLRPHWRFSLSEELTRNHYRLFFIGRWESLSQMSWEWNDWKILSQYRLEPKSFRQAPILYTGSFRLGRQVLDRKLFNLFYAVSSPVKSLKNPEVWRVGFEFVDDFF